MPVTEDIKIEDNVTKAEDVVEKRVKPTVIRRRKMKAAPEEAKPAETVAAEAVKEKKAEAPAIKSAAGKKEAKGEKAVAAKPQKVEIEEKKKGLKIIAQPEEAKGPESPEPSVARLKPPPGESDIDKLIRRPARKRKSRSELEFEDIRKYGGLKQYAEEFASPEAPSSAPLPSRVFEPGLRARKRKSTRKGKKTLITEKKAIKKIIRVHEGITVSELSQSMGVKANDIIKKLIGLGMLATINQTIDVDTATLVATDYGYEVEHAAFREEDVLKAPGKKEEKGGEPRSPVVTVMGHVDHGKTSILDVIRKTDVASGEAGGITQHIGAYTVLHAGKAITFVDTPGHEAFTHMRARGAQVTDIVVLVVAADDGVMPQTMEAIDHAKAAGVPIIVAINKVDKPNANPDKVKRELSEVELLPEDWGGQTICVRTSARTKEGIDQLLEMILLQAEVLELKARYDGRAEGIIIESRMDKKRGPVVAGIVKGGTLKPGDAIVSGPAWGRARSLNNDKGDPVEEVFPSQPVEILGLSDVPEAGEAFIVVTDEKTARTVVENRMRRQREESLAKRAKVSLEDLKTRIEAGETKDLNVIVKTDVKGVADAIRDSLPGLSTKEVKINVIHTGVGGINEGDVMLASASNAIILGFNVVADIAARDLAEKENVEIKRYSIIYELLEDIKNAIAGMLAPRVVETALGRAEVKETFKLPKIGIIAGCLVTSGRVTRNARLRLLRDNVIIHDGRVVSLKRFKDDAREVVSGQECGIGIEKFGDIKIGDEIEAYITEEIAVTWEESKGEGPKPKE